MSGSNEIRDKLSRELDDLRSRLANLEKFSEEQKDKIDHPQQSDDIYQALIKSSGDLIFVTTANGYFKFISPSVNWILGYDPDEWIGKKLFDYVHPEDKTKAQRVFSELIEIGSSATRLFNCRFLKSNGSWICFECLSSNHFTDSQIKGLVTNCRDITETRKPAKIIKEKEDQFKNFTENLIDLVIAVDQEDKVIYINKAGMKLTGYSFDEAVSKSISDFFPRHELSKLDGLKTKTSSRDGNIFLEWMELLQKSGQKLALEVHTVSVEVEGRKLKLFTGRDFSELKKIEDEVNKTKDLYALAGIAGKISVWNWDLNLSEIVFTPDIRSMLGLESKGEKISINGWMELVHPEDRDKIMDEFEIYLKGLKSKFEVEHRMLDKDGNIRWLLSRGIAVRDEKWEPYRIMGTCADITEIKLMGRALTKSEERNKVLLRAIPDIMFKCTREGKFIDYHAPKEHEFFLSTRKIIGKNIYDAFPEDIAAKAMFHVEKAFQTGRIQMFEFQPDLTQKTFYEARVVLSENNEVIFIIRDISKRKIIEEEIKKAKTAAEAGNTAKSEFLANMSHELRTPLNAILGYAQILKRDENLTSGQQESLDVVERSGNHLLNLINDILDLSKIEAQEMSIDESNFMLHTFLNGIAEMIRLKAELKGLIFQYETSPDLPLVIRGDEKRISQVLLNLLSNAVKFTAKGTVALKVSPHEDKIRFLVEDTGIGISEDKLDEIFSPFKQLKIQSNRVEGTGLGLAISRKLVDLMGGELNVRSNPQEGSSFWFDLTLPEITDYKGMREFEDQRIIGYKGNRRKILIVDDKKDNRSVIVQLLVPLGFDIFEAIDGRDGLNKALEIEPDLILMDLVMPVMNGYEATRQIRELEGMKSTKIIAISASVAESSYQSSIETGCDDYLPKPVWLNSLLEKLKFHLNLEWTYEQPGKPLKPVSIGKLADRERIVAPAEEASLLYRAAKNGDIESVHKYLDEMEKLDEKYHNFVFVVREFAKKFQINEMCEFVKKYKGSES